MTDTAAHMDSIYRLQRHIYDLTRKPYLLGRDVMIDGLAVPPGGSVLEIGCGTARNLLKIAEHYPHARCFGLDVSSVMLETAEQSIRRSQFADRVRVAKADACDFSPSVLFGVERFDRVVISYALSMIPGWEQVLDAAASLLTDTGTLHVVDFGDQSGLPNWFRQFLYAWLALFSVTPRTNLMDQMTQIASVRSRTAVGRKIYRGYAIISELRPQPNLTISA